MSTISRPHTFRLIFSIISATLAAGNLAISAFAANISLIANDAASTTTTSFNAAGNWSNSAPPTSGNAYFTSTFTLRGPNNSTNYTFGGGSLSIGSGGRLLGKSTSTTGSGQTLSVSNLILNGGYIDQANGGTNRLTIAGAINVASASGLGAYGTSTTSWETLDISAVIGGSGTLTIGGAINGGGDKGLVKLSAANTAYSGKVVVANTVFFSTAGLLQLNHLDALAGAELNNLNATANAVSFASAVNTGTFRLGALSGSGSLALVDTVGAPITLNVGGNGATTTYSGALTGAGNLVKSGSGTLTLSGANTFSGNLTVSAGTLTLGSANLGNLATVSVASGGILRLDFTGTDTVASLVLGGVPQGNGTYDSSNTGGRLAGTGKIQVVSAIVSPYRSTRVWKAFDGATAPTVTAGSYFPKTFMSVSASSSTSSLQLAGGGATSTIYYSAGDAGVVGIAANALRDDIQRVTGLTPAVSTATPSAPAAVLIGTIGKSSLIDGLVSSGKINVSSIRGKWEAYSAAVIDNPMAGVNRALVIAGSDRRGTAYGVFALSESMGVSPWYWFGDIPVASQPALFIAGSHTQVSPAVKYRGIFINDEDVGFLKWAQNFDPTGNVGPTTYARVFELMLRLKANYLWPAMHGSTKPFFTVAGNAAKADQYAIVIGTSHHEPVLRNTLTEYNTNTIGEYNYWTNRTNIYNWFDQRVAETGGGEYVYTVGMRGLADNTMVAPAGTTVAQKRDMLQNAVIPDQRQMLTNHVNSDPSQIPQVFVPYKEGLSIYQAGLQLPEDVTIVWPDDNHGYIRQLSNPTERARSGGSGVYFHLSYWGGSLLENYLWLCSTPPGFTHSEMIKAWDYEARNMWIVNVGDIKPMEMGMEFFLRMANNPEAYRDFDQHTYFVQWANRHFGAANASAIASILTEYYRLNIAARPEQLNRTTSGFSFVDGGDSTYGDEAEKRLAEFNSLTTAANTLYAQIPATQQAAFYQMILYPIRGSDRVNQKILNAERSRLWQTQGRAATNTLAASVSASQTQLQTETTFYNQTNAGGKWRGMMTWTNDGGAYSTPFTLPATGSYAAPTTAGLGVAVQGSATPLPAGTPGFLPTFNRPANEKFFIDVFNTGTNAFSWTAQTSESWITLSKSSGNADARIMVGVNWAAAPRGDAVPATITIQGAGGSRAIHVTASYPTSLNLSSLPEAVESNGKVVIHADRYTAAEGGANGTAWTLLPDSVLSGDGMTVQPVTAPSVSTTTLPTGAPALTFQFHSFSIGSVSIETRCRPTQPATSVNPGARYAISLNGDALQIRDIKTAEFSGEWLTNIRRGYAGGKTNHIVSTSGLQTVTIWMVDPGVVIDRLVVNIASGLNEAEDLVATSTNSLSPVTESTASGGEAVTLNATAAGQTVRFTTLSLAAGSYNLTLGIKKGPNRGIAQLAVGETASGPFTNIGGPVDFYAASLGYVAMPSVPVTFSSSGPKYLRFTVTGKNTASSGYWLVFDYFKFETVRTTGAFALSSPARADFETEASSNEIPDTADHDQDGIPNLLEYALGSSPTSSNAVPWKVEITGDNRLALTFPRQNVSDITYRVMASSDLTSDPTEIWSSATTNFPDKSLSSVMTTVVDTQSLSASKARFLWLSVTRQ